MGFFDKPEVVILKESSDAKVYLEKLENLYKEIPENSELAQKVEKEIAITKAGIIGEDQIMFELKNSGMDLVVLHDIYMEDADGNGAQIDYLIVTQYVRVFIECKNLFGNIEINNKGDFIRTMQFGKRFVKEGIYSPITQNERHMRVYRDIMRAKKGMLLGALFNKNFENYNKSLVVLANPKTVVNDKYAKAEVKNQVIRADQLITTLKSLKSDLKSNKKEMLEFGERFLSLNIEERKDYFAKFEELKKELDSISTQASLDNEAETVKVEADITGVEADIILQTEGQNESGNNVDSAEEQKIEVAEKSMICPRCGAQLVLRTAKKGDNAGNQFYGCSSFPKCRYVQNLK